MQAAVTDRPRTTGNPYAKSIEVSKRVRWEIDRDVIRGRQFDLRRKFLPDSLSKVGEIAFLSADEKRLMSQVQGRTYAYIFGLAERFIGAKVMEVARDHSLGDQDAFEAMIRFADEELKHQALFRRIEDMLEAAMPAGYVRTADPNAVAEAVLGASTWAVLGLTCNIEIFTQVHYRSSIEPDGNLSDLWKDVFLYHWREESQHAILDELEWQREDAKLDDAQRDRAVDDLIGLVGALDGILQAQARADTGYFTAIAGRPFDAAETAAIEAGILKAYRWQYIVVGVQEPRFANLLAALVTPRQLERIGAALAPILA
jgi:hypothetical protein